jgi:hypothetical protein
MPRIVVSPGVVAALDLPAGAHHPLAEGKLAVGAAVLRAKTLPVSVLARAMASPPKDTPVSCCARPAPPRPAGTSSSGCWRRGAGRLITPSACLVDHSHAPLAGQVSTGARHSGGGRDPMTTSRGPRLSRMGTRDVPPPARGAFRSGADLLFLPGSPYGRGRRTPGSLLSRFAGLEGREEVKRFPSTIFEARGSASTFCPKARPVAHSASNCGAYRSRGGTYCLTTNVRSQARAHPGGQAATGSREPSKRAATWYP